MDYYMAIDALSITAIIISSLTTISGIIAGFHLKRSNCLGNSCECYESEQKKIERIKSIIRSENNSPNNNKTFDLILSQPKEENI